MHKKIEFENLPVIISIESITRKNTFFHENVVEFAFVMEGEVDFINSDNLIHLEQGDFITINAGIPHSIETHGKNCKIASIYLDLNYFEKEYPYIHGMSISGVFTKETEYQADRYRLIRNYFIRMLIVNHNAMPDMNQNLISLAGMMLNLLMTHIKNYEYSNVTIGELKEEQIERVYRITSFLSYSYRNKGLSLADIANHEHLSETRVAHFWKEHLNYGFNETLLMYRIGEARRRLMDNEMTISEITEHCGFSDEKYLYKHFKNTFNKTPKQFRERHLQSHKQKEKYKTLDMNEEHEAILKYSNNYYVTVDDIEFLGYDQGKYKREINIDILYNLIMVKDNISDSIDWDIQDHALFDISEYKGLLPVGKKYRIDWEYIYAICRWCNIAGLPIGFTFNMGFLFIDTLEMVIHEIWHEVLNKWGKKTSKQMRLIFMSKNKQEYDNAKLLKSRLLQEDVICDIRPTFML